MEYSGIHGNKKRFYGIQENLRKFKPRLNSTFRNFSEFNPFGWNSDNLNRVYIELMELRGIEQSVSIQSA